ncbi:UDP-glucose 4-epimerase family protein [Dechloromonas hortensis]|uniref:UDP-glucose 4-epimerase family protein n=1 Tax=Dechloromonas hortensis TaxID=337779 RepID=UPI001292AB54|nr:SDR family oxidoreductase [Dechloromonas hortensis]
MTVLVTGANGFVGSALCESLSREAVSVRGVVRTLKSHPSCIEDIVIARVSSGTDWTFALRNVREVVHLAARAHVMNDRCSDQLAEFRSINVAVTANLARQAAAAGVRRFIFVSSIKVNGELTRVGQPFTADDLPAPEDRYGVSKHEAEQILWQIASETGMEVVVLRPPLVYGPGVKGNFLRLMQTIDKQLPLPFGAIRNRRSLIYLGNLVDVIRLCLTHPEAAGKSYLVSDGDDVSTPELIRRVATALGCRLFLVPVPVSWIRWVGGMLAKQAVVDRLLGSLYADIEPLREGLGWRPPYTMQAGLEATAHWYRNTKANT